MKLTTTIPLCVHPTCTTCGYTWCTLHECRYQANGNNTYGNCNAVKRLDLLKYTKERYDGPREWLIWGGTTAILGTVELSVLNALMIGNGFEDPFMVSVKYRPNFQIGDVQIQNCWTMANRRLHLLQEESGNMLIVSPSSSESFARAR